MRRWAVALGVALGLSAMPVAGWAEPEEPAPVPVVTLDALPLEIPLTALSEPGRTRAEAVLARSIFAQRVTGIRYRSRDAVFRFLLDHPDFAASVARALRVGEYRITSHPDGYWGDDNRGAKGLIRILYADDHRRLYHLEGRYERGLMPTIEGQILVLFEFRHDDTEDGSVVDSSLTGHIRIDTPVVGALAQVVSTLTRPLVERAVERKIRRFFDTVARVSRWAHDEPEQLAAALDGHPEMDSGPTFAAFRAVLLAGRPPAWARVSFRLLDGPLLDSVDPHPRLTGPQRTPTDR